MRDAIGLALRQRSSAASWRGPDRLNEERPERRQGAINRQLAFASFFQHEASGCALVQFGGGAPI
jgi:hypothetical protein